MDIKNNFSSIKGLKTACVT